MSARLAVFDCDGTLVDGQAAVCNAMEETFRDAGLPSPDRHDIRRIVGLSLPVAIRRLAPDADDARIPGMVDSYKQAFFAARQAGLVEEPLFDGIERLLNDLRQRGWMLGVATGKSDRGLKRCLANHGLLGHFLTLQTADRHPSKPHPSMLQEAMDDALVSAEATVMIGDTAYDIEMAHNAGVRAIGVAWGYHEAAELLDAGADAVARTVAELGDMLR